MNKFLFFKIEKCKLNTQRHRNSYLVDMKKFFFKSENNFYLQSPAWSDSWGREGGHWTNFFLDMWRWGRCGDGVQPLCEVNRVEIEAQHQVWMNYSLEWSWEWWLATRGRRASGCEIRVRVQTIHKDKIMFLHKRGWNFFECIFLSSYDDVVHAMLGSNMEWAFSGGKVSLFFVVNLLWFNFN